MVVLAYYLAITPNRRRRSFEETNAQILEFILSSTETKIGLKVQGGSQRGVCLFDKGILSN